MFDAQRLRQLQALGLSPMRLRDHGAGESSASTSPMVHEDVVSTALPVHAWFPAGETDAFTGPYAHLLAQILKCLGLRPDQVRPGLPAEGETAVLLAFGPGAPQGAIRLSALAKLRDPIEKRVAWPVLRDLRRRLRQIDG